MIADNTEDTLITWLLVTVCSSNMIKNPYLVAKLIEVIFVIIPSIQPRCEPMYNRLMSHHISCTMLPSSLMKFYTDVRFVYFTKKKLFSLQFKKHLQVETTGSSSEFYDKFSIRYHISLIIKGCTKKRSVVWGLQVVCFRNVGLTLTQTSRGGRVKERQSVCKVYQHVDERHYFFVGRIVGIVETDSRDPRTDRR